MANIQFAAPMRRHVLAYRPGVGWYKDGVLQGSCTAGVAETSFLFPSDAERAALLRVSGGGGGGGGGFNSATVAGGGGGGSSGGGNITPIPLPLDRSLIASTPLSVNCGIGGALGAVVAAGGSGGHTDITGPFDLAVDNTATRIRFTFGGGGGAGTVTNGGAGGQTHSGAGTGQAGDLDAGAIGPARAVQGSGLINNSATAFVTLSPNAQVAGHGSPGGGITTGVGSAGGSTSGPGPVYYLLAGGAAGTAGNVGLSGGGNGGTSVYGPGGKGGSGDGVAPTAVPASSWGAGGAAGQGNAAGLAGAPGAADFEYYSAL